ncbi:ABC transporter permease [Clostridium botulinum]|uniref:ABC transporter, permease protein n=1 Tax=Clostridium botulinum (strain Hall / ATCC 3502 / NCTC 13319 / Type A) TaxID=441771 RepID=A5HZV8_CLOBH|nr:ABC transporter permease subunit [Clostridium botulinum]MBY6843526.1 ABC transporter permease subunit [Clostridium botulinum]NFL70335.1 ABC transporter permease [Clostridium botulinum]NFQ53560.1 ABC transporter permease [Clostridium botulinum]NFT44723.1 ABC transporter permease [Clostridium botulinum]CAL82319.1 ABC transporter, permease protein [Clostridium botulinum A str. ATCC 3502]
MAKYIWEELKRVLIKKKISIIIILIIIVAFGGVNIFNKKTLDERLEKAKIILNNQIKFKEDEKAINDTKQEISDIEKTLSMIKNYDKSKIDEKILKLEKENNPENDYEISLLKYEKKNNIEKKELMPKGMYTTMEFLAQPTISIFYILILIELLSDILSGEYAPNNIKMSLTKPISRKKIIISKFVVSTIIGASAIIISTIIFIIEAGIHFGLSDYKMPFDVGAKYVLNKSLPLTVETSQMEHAANSISVVPLWSMIVRFVLIAILVSIVSISIIIFISAICKRSLISSIINFILIIITSLAYNWRFMSNNILANKYGALLKFIPIPYIFDIPEVSSGDVSIRLASSINIFFVLIVCVVWTLIMMFLSTYIFAKRDFD